MAREVVLTSVAASEALALKVATLLPARALVGLCGSLGAGKTTFVRAVVRALVGEDVVSSPTFVLCHEYRRKDGGKIEHWDLYRLSAAPPELAEESEPLTLRLVEWLERAPELLAEADLIVRFEFLPRSECESPEHDTMRRVIFEGPALETWAVGIEPLLCAL